MIIAEHVRHIFYFNNNYEHHIIIYFNENHFQGYKLFNPYIEFASYEFIPNDTVIPNL